MRKPGGYTFLTDGDGRVHEGETFTCRHCQRITMVGARQRPEDLGGMCTICSSLICSGCVGKGCDPFEEKQKREFARYEALRSYGLV
jgi:hypothetical protein